MADNDVLGPGAAGAPRALPSSDPSIIASIQFPDAADTWFQDCVNNTAGTGTPYVAEWANRQLQQIRRVIRNSGVALPYADDQLSFAIQQGLVWVGTFGGSANALTGTLVPAPSSLVAGTEIKGLVAATNTGAATLTVGGTGAFPITRADGTALLGGEMVIGGVAAFVFTGTSYVLLTPSPSIFVREVPTNTWFVDFSLGADAPGQGLSSGAGAFATMQYAVNTISGYFSSSQINVHVAGGTTAAAANTNICVVGSASIGSWNFIGNGRSGAGATILNANATGASAFIASQGSNVTLNGFQCVAQVQCISAQNGASLTSQNNNCVMAGASSTAYSSIFSGNLSLINATTTISGTGSSCFATGIGGTMGIGNAGAPAAITFSGVTVADTALAQTGGTLFFTPSGVSFSGTPTGARFNASTAGGISTLGSGTSYIPGTSAGTTTAPGWFS